MSTDAPNFVPVDGATLAVWTLGGRENAPLLVLHGGPGESHDTLRPWLDPLAAIRRVIYFDQRGCGASKLGPGSPLPTRQALVADVEAVREWLAVDEFDVLGFSWGASLALLYGEAHPRRVRRLVLVSPSPAGSDRVGSLAQRMDAAAKRPEVVSFLEQASGLDRDDADPATRDRAQFAKRVAAFFAHPERALALTPGSFSPDVAKAVEASLEGWRAAPAVTALSAVPTLVVRGALDPIPPEIADDLAAKLGGAPPAVIDDAGHAPFVEAQDAFISAVSAFLSRPIAPRGGA